MSTHHLPRSQRTSISYLATIVSRRGADSLTRLMAAEGLSRPHFTVISALAEFGPMSQVDLAESTQLNRGHLVGFIDELVAHGSLTRDPDPNDRRKNVISLTPAGVAFTVRVSQSEAANEERAFAMLTPAERETLRSLLRRVLDEDAAPAEMPAVASVAAVPAVASVAAVPAVASVAAMPDAAPRTPEPGAPAVGPSAVTPSAPRA